MSTASRYARYLIGHPQVTRSPCRSLGQHEFNADVRGRSLALWDLAGKTAVSGVRMLAERRRSCGVCIEVWRRSIMTWGDSVTIG